MNKFFAAALGAALLFGAQGASAFPVTVEISISGFDGSGSASTSGTCANKGGTYSGGVGGVCSLTADTVAGIGFTSYGGVGLFAGLLGAAEPNAGMIQPEFWLTFDANMPTTPSTITVGAFVTGYTFPSSGVPVPYHLTTNGVANASISWDAGLYLSGGTTNPYGNLLSLAAGNLIASAGGIGQLPAPYINSAPFNYVGANYSLGWVETINTAGNGHFGLYATTDRVPAPAAIGMLGFGLAGLAGAIRRRRRA